MTDKAPTIRYNKEKTALTHSLARTLSRISPCSQSVSQSNNFSAEKRKFSPATAAAATQVQCSVFFPPFQTHFYKRASGFVFFFLRKNHPRPVCGCVYACFRVHCPGSGRACWLAGRVKIASQNQTTAEPACVCVLASPFWFSVCLLALGHKGWKRKVGYRLLGRAGGVIDGNGQLLGGGL